MQSTSKRTAVATAGQKRGPFSIRNRWPLIFCLAILCALIAGGPNSAASDGAMAGKRPGPQAKELLTTFWQQVKERDVKGLETTLDPSWQVARADGTYMNRSVFLAKLGKGEINLNDFKIGRMNVTQSESSLVVRYLTRAAYTIKGIRYKESSAPYLATFIRKGGRWLMTSQANFDIPAE